MDVPVMATNEANKKPKKKSKKRKHASSDEAEHGSTSFAVEGKHKKKCKKKHKHSKSKKHKKDKEKTRRNSNDQADPVIGPEIPNELLKKSQLMAPMSKSAWQKKQTTLRRIYDEGSGRSRLVRGRGEIVEEIVSKERHQEINRQATQGDGKFFQSSVSKHVK